MQYWKGRILAESIEEYIKQLRRELAGSDPALIQDALYE